MHDFNRFIEFKINFRKRLKAVLISIFSIILFVLNLKNLIPFGKSNSKTLIVKYGNIGDIYVLLKTIRKLHTTRSIDDIVIAVPSSHVGLVKRHFSSMQILQLPNLRKPSPLELTKSILSLRSEKYETMIAVGGSSSPFEEEFAAVITRAKYKARSVPDKSKGSSVSHFLSGYYYSVSRKQTDLLESQIMDDLVESIFQVKLEEQFQSILRKNTETREYITIFPGASVSARRWTAGTLSKLITLCQENFPDYDVYVIGTSDEYNEYQVECEKTWLPGVHFNFDVKSLEELEKWIEASHLVITNDSGPLHIGRFFKKNLICVCGQGHLNRFVGSADFNLTQLECANCNWSCQFRLENGKYRCVTQLEGYVREIELFRFFK